MRERERESERVYSQTLGYISMVQTAIVHACQPRYLLLPDSEIFFINKYGRIRQPMSYRAHLNVH